MAQKLYETTIQYINFLKSYRKKNGENLLHSTIERYAEILNKYIPNISKMKDEDELIKFMNEEIKKRRSIVLFSAFRNYLIFKGMDQDGKKIKDLRTPNVNANAFNSKRFIQSKVLSRQELSTIYNECSNNFDKMIFSFLYDTACRRDELLSIKHKHIVVLDPEKPNEAKDIKKGIYAKVLLHGKGSKTREVYLGMLSVNLYKSLFPKSKKDDLVFVILQPNGKPYKFQYQGLYDKIVRHCKSALDRHIHPHMFRHSRLTHLADEGADILGLKAYAGHEDVSTSQIYVEISTFVGKRLFSKFSRSIID